MDAGDETKFWEISGVTAIGQLPGFPFKTHSALIGEVLSGSVELGIDYQAARELIPVIKGSGARILLSLLGWVPLGAAPIASIALALATGRWLYLIGIVLGVFALFMSSPYNPSHTFFFKISLLAVAFPILAWHSIEPRVWLPVAFGTSFLAARSVNRLAWSWTHDALIKSEALAAALWKTNSIFLRSLSLGTVSARLAERKKMAGE